MVLGLGHLKQEFRDNDPAGPDRFGGQAKLNAQLHTKSFPALSKT